MRDHAIIGKFLGIWPLEKSLIGWMESRWKIKGEINLKLGAKGILHNNLLMSGRPEKVF
jgi:hypothetical protein